VRLFSVAVLPIDPSRLAAFWSATGGRELAA